jgi:hypothetical protein
MTDKDRLGRYVGPRTEHLELIAPGLKYNTGRGLQMALEVGAATAGSMSGMHCELVDIRGMYFPKPAPVIAASEADSLTPSTNSNEAGCRDLGSQLWYRRQ